MTEHKIIRMGFDPLSDPETAAVFADDLARTFYLCWRPGHIVSQHFPAKCLRIADMIRRKNATTEAEVYDAMEPTWVDITAADAKNFIPGFLPYLRGEKTIGYEVVK